MKTFTAQDLRFVKDSNRLLLHCLGVDGQINSRYLDLENTPHRINYIGDKYQLMEIAQPTSTAGMDFSLGLTVTMDAEQLEHQKGKFSLGFAPVVPKPEIDPEMEASSSIMGIGTVDLMDVDTGEDMGIRPLAPIVREDTNAAGGTGGGGTATGTTSGEVTNEETSSGFWSKIKNFFLRLFGKSPAESGTTEDPATSEDPVASEDPVTTDETETPKVPALRQCILEYQILLNSQATLEISAVNAFDMVILRTSKDNVGITRKPTGKN